MFFQTTNIKNFSLKYKSTALKKNIKASLKYLISSKSHILSSMKNNYRDSYDKTLISDFKKYKNINLIGMGGSSLGSKAIYNFLNLKKKNFNFIDNFSNIDLLSNTEKKINVIISKSGNTLETICNSNILSNSKKNIILTEKKKQLFV